MLVLWEWGLRGRARGASSPRPPLVSARGPFRGHPCWAGLVLLGKGEG